jgi:hypothetical protein
MPLEILVNGRHASVCDGCKSIRASTYALMEGSDLTRTKKGQRYGTVGWRVPASDDSILQVRNRDYHPGYRHRRDRIEMMRILRLADGSFRRHGSLAAAHLTDRCARRTIRAATLRGGTSHHRRNTKADRKKRSDQKYGDKAHEHHRSPDRQNPQQRPKHPASRHPVRRIGLDPITLILGLGRTRSISRKARAEVPRGAQPSRTVSIQDTSHGCDLEQTRYYFGNFGQRGELYAKIASNGLG